MKIFTTFLLKSKKIETDKKSGCFFSYYTQVISLAYSIKQLEFTLLLLIMLCYSPCVIRGMKQKVTDAFTQIRMEIDEFWTNNNIDDYVFTDEDDTTYPFEDMELYFDFEIKNKKMYITGVSDETTGAFIEFKHEYIFDFNEDMCKNDDEPYYFKDDKIYEFFGWDILEETLKSICTGVKYMNHIYTLDTLQKECDDKFEIACIISKIGLTSFSEIVPYINGKNVLKYM